HFSFLYETIIAIDKLADKSPTLRRRLTIDLQSISTRRFDQLLHNWDLISCYIKFHIAPPVEQTILRSTDSSLPGPR
ncbi:unnamed protein product, partial [Nesidiocoris tenuis]